MKGKIFLFLFLMIMSLGMVNAFSGSGSGTIGDPYQVTSASEFGEVGESAYYKIMNDIDISSLGVLSPAVYFSLDGDGHTIYGVDNTIFSAFNGSIFNLTINTTSGTFNSQSIFASSVSGNIDYLKINLLTSWGWNVANNGVFSSSMSNLNINHFGMDFNGNLVTGHYSVSAFTIYIFSGVNISNFYIYDSRIQNGNQGSSVLFSLDIYNANINNGYYDGSANGLQVATNYFNASFNGFFQDIYGATYFGFDLYQSQEQLKNKSFLESQGWDFVNTWQICPQINGGFSSLLGLDTICPTNTTCSNGYPSFFPCDLNNTIYELDFSNINVNFSSITGSIDEGDIQYGFNWIYIDSLSDANVPAKIVFYNVSSVPFAQPYKNGVLCVDCLDTLEKFGDMMIFNVSGFSNYSFIGGDGSEANPFLISTLLDFEAINGESDVFFRVISDVDMTGMTSINGTNISIDGNEHTLYNVDNKLFYTYYGSIYDMVINITNLIDSSSAFSDTFYGNMSFVKINFLYNVTVGNGFSSFIRTVMDSNFNNIAVDFNGNTMYCQDGNCIGGGLSVTGLFDSMTNTTVNNVYIYDGTLKNDNVSILFITKTGDSSNTITNGYAGNIIQIGDSGEGYDNIIINNFFQDSDEGTGGYVDTVNLTSQSFLESQGWDFNVWQVCSEVNDGYPSLIGLDIRCPMLGSGTIGDPYQINKCDYLNNIENNLSAYYILTADINCSGFNWTPISNFTGNLDGQGFMVYDLNITTKIAIMINQSYGNIINFNLYGSMRNSLLNGYKSGGLILDNYGNITNSFTSINVYSYDASGFLLNNYGNMINCSTNSTLNSRYLGGLVEYNYGNIAESNFNGYSSGTSGGELGGIVRINYGSIINSKSFGNVYGTSGSSSIVGSFVSYNYGNINNCSSFSNVSGRSIGGFVSYNYGNITDSFYDGITSGIYQFGGFVYYNFGGYINHSYTNFTRLSSPFRMGGFAYSNTGLIENSYTVGQGFTGGTTGQSGFIYQNNGGTILNSYTTSASQVTNGFAYSNSGTCTNNYWDIEISGANSSACGTGLTDNQSKIETYYVGFDFNDTWQICEETNSGYPSLQALSPVEICTAPNVTYTEPIVCSLCTETCSPCGGGCTSTELDYMYDGYDWASDVNGYGDITGWDTSCITSTVGTFGGGSDFNQDISGWNTSSVNDMNQMFIDNSYFNQPIGSWDTSSVNDMSYMFSATSAFNQDISGWDTSSVSTMSGMFADASSFNQDISGWDVSNVGDMSYMFSSSSFNQDISGWDVSNVGDMSYMFSSSSFNQDISGWSVISLTTMQGMFESSYFNQDISGWDVSNVDNMAGMFSNSHAFSQDIIGWDTSSVIYMSNMFDGAEVFNNNLSGWNFGSVTDMSLMFNGVNLSISFYDALLIDIYNTYGNSGVTFDGGLSQYSIAGNASRAGLITDDGWTITDGGLYTPPPVICDFNLSTLPCDINGTYDYNVGDVLVNFTTINGTVYSGDILSNNTWVYVNSSSVANVAATITFSNINDSNYVPFRDGIYCGLQCSNILNNGTVLSFDVTGFSNYSYGPGPNGSGTIGDPYQLSTCFEMEYMEANSSAYYIMINDIDCNGFNFTPITNFTGNLDGQGYDVYNFYKSANGSSLFYTITGNISNFNLNGTMSLLNGNFSGLALNNYGIITNTNINMNISGRFAIGMVNNNYGSILNSSYIGNLIVSSTGFTGKLYAGITRNNYGFINDSSFIGNFIGSVGGDLQSGIAYQNFGTIDNAFSNITYTGFGGGNFGGVAIGNSGNITNCYVTGLSEKGGSGTSNNGGVTRDNGGNIINCVVDMTIYGSRVGGITKENTGNIINTSFIGILGTGDNSDAGFVWNNNGNITNSFTNMNVTSGMVGFSNFVAVNNAAGIIKDCYSLNDKITQIVGRGFVRTNNGNITNSYSVGLTTTNSGFAFVNGGTCQDSFWDVNVSNQTNSSCGIGLTTTQMKLESSFTNWDFNNTWQICSEVNDGYPSLIGINEECPLAPANNAPTINSYSPVSLTPTISAKQVQAFSISANDTENDTLSYEWYVNGTPQSQNSTSFTANGTTLGIGVYTITAEVYESNNSANNDTQSWTLTVIANWPPVINSYLPVSLTPSIDNLNVQAFSVAATDVENDGLSYEWYINGSSQSHNSSSFTANGTTLGLGTYNITAIVNDSTDVDTQSWTLTVTAYVNVPPVINSYSPIDITPDIWTIQTQLFTVSTSDNDTIYGDVISYEWYVDGTPQSRNLPTFTALGNSLGVGVFNITTTVSDLYNHTVYQTWHLNVTIRPNQAPVINTFSPTDTTPEIYLGNSQAFSISVTDVDLDNLSYEWYVNGTPQSNNISSFIFNGTSLGSYAIMANVSDGNNHSASQSWVLSVVVVPNYAPTIDSYLPLDLTPMITTEQIQAFNITASDIELNDLSYEWYVNGTPQSNNQTTYTANGTTFGVGSYLIMAKVYESNYSSNNDTHSWDLTVLPPGPIMQSIDLQPIVVSPQNHIVGSCLATGDGMLNITYEFIRNNLTYQSDYEVVASGEELSISLGATLVVGDVWYFRCNATDNQSRSSGWSQSVNRTVLPNQFPVVSASLGNLPLYDVFDTLPVYCGATDSNGDNVTFDFRVFREGLLYYQNSTPGYYNTPTTQLMVVITNDSDFVIGEEWYAACRAYDGLNLTDWINSSVTTVLRDARPPVTSYARIYPIIMLNNSQLYATALASDVNGDNLYYSYTLYENGVAVEVKSQNDLPQSTESIVNFTYASLVAGRDMSVGVTVSDINYTINQTNSTAITVRNNNNAPSTQTVRMSPDAFVNDNDNILGYCTGIDVDGDTLSYNYVWYSNNVSIKSGTKIYSIYGGYTQATEVLVDTLSAAQTVEGELLRFSCQPNDTVAVGSYLNTSPVIIYGINLNNNVPEVKSLTVTPTSGDTFQDFNITVRIKDKDDNVSARVEWRIVKNGLFQPVITTEYYNLTKNVERIISLGEILDSYTDSGDFIYVRARVFDGFDYSGWANSNTINIANVAPVMVSSTILNTPYENATLVSECIASDVDDQTITFDKIWYNNGVQVSTLENLPTSLTQAGDSIILSCRAFDGTAYSPRLNSSAVIIIDTSTAPTISSISLTGEINTLYGDCNVFDIEGDLVNYTAMFYKNNTLQNTQNRSVMSGITERFNYTTTLTAGDAWSFYCQGTTVDGSVNSTAALTIPAITFGYSVDLEIQKITVNWATNADYVKVWLGNTSYGNTTLGRQIFEGLTPNTLYTITLQPVKNGYSGPFTIFNATTKQTDNNNPVIRTLSINPTPAYTDTVLQGYCNASDVESVYVFYTYSWYVNEILVDSGVTTLKPSNSVVLIDTLLSSYIEFNDTVRFSCIAYDGIGSSNESSSNITILNTPQTISNAFVIANDTEYYCGYDYSDLDSDNQIFVSYQWFKNGVDMSINTSSISAVGIVAPDTLMCIINSSTLYHTLLQNSSIFSVGDFELPSISNMVVPSSVYTDTAYEIKVDCVDNVRIASGYPRITFINPNLLEGEYPIFSGVGDSFSRYLTFPIAGEYTEIEFACKDGNGNTKIEKYLGTITAKVRATTVEGPGSTPSGEERTVFSIKPKEQDFNVNLGQTRIIEFEVVNEIDEDVSFTMAILVNGENPEAYKWMSFEGGLKAITFDIQRKGSLSTGGKFIRYYITVPKDAPLGSYKGIIEVNGKGQTRQYVANIEVTTGTQFPLLAFLNYELFEIPFTATPTGAVIGGVEETIGKPFKVWMLLLFVSAVIGLFMLRSRLKRRG